MWKFKKCLYTKRNYINFVINLKPLEMDNQQQNFNNQIIQDYLSGININGLLEDVQRL